MMGRAQVNLRFSGGPGAKSSAVSYQVRPEMAWNPLIELGALQGKPKHPAYLHKNSIFEDFTGFQWKGVSFLVYWNED